MKFRIFVDGEAGTTGLQINERLAKRDDVELLHIDPELRKDAKERQRLINESDVTFLCLPDAASKESAELCTNPKTKIIDASTAHRTNPAWAYGLPELSSDFRKALETNTRIANPGCHASGFILGVYPLIAAGLLKKDADLATYSLTGYSGGGKKMIASYEAEGAQISHPGESPRLFAPRPYALGHHHK
ncbi:MAG: N-acetyl-gamma-glutamyl-phosphate reductase, partial [Fibrobacter sp.]|nr:N-acetyl-gamma-glutamyl-phosphate reductase [Fibrobacter sp.]